MRYLVLLILLSSCYTANKARRQVLHAEAVYPDRVASLCGNLYPPVDSVRTEIRYKEGKPVPYKEVRYVKVNCDSLIANVPIKTINHTFTIPCPPSDSMRVDTTEITDRISKSNYALQAALQAQVAQVSTDKDKATQRAKTYGIAALIELGLFILIVVGWVLSRKAKILT